MRTQSTDERVSNRKRRFFLALLAGFSTSGCATSPEPRPSAFSQTAPLPQSAVAGNETKPPNVSQTQPPQLSSTILTIAYNEGLVSAAPQPVFVQDAEEAEGGKPSDSESIEETAQPEVVRPPNSNSVSATGTQQPAQYFVSVAMAGHPKLRAARQRVAAATNVAPQVSALPDPMFNNTFWPMQNQALQTAGGRVGHQFGLSQGVPWPEKLRTKAAIANREVQMAQAEVDRIEREITEAVRLAYYEVWFTTRAIAIIQETRELVDDLTQVAEARYKSGGSQQDVLRAQLEADRLDDQIVTLRKQKEQAQADLAALVQQPVSLIPEASEELGLTNVPERLDGLLVLAEQCSPELRAIAWEIQRDRQKQKLACLQKYPDLQVGLNYAIISDDSNAISPVANGHDNISFTVGTTLPIWREKINAGIREAAHRTTSSTERLEAERDAIQGKLRRLMAQADALVQQQDIYKKRIIPRTEDTLKLSIADYRGKRTDFFTLIETYRDLLMFETQMARFEATLAGTVAQIERTVGCP
ncbi:putative outer membrane efflux protein MdtP [Aureliella helgolandensis]|uniref:Putative outer membrane efflux protein MdtP n=1 Tax=Aureliella helgolandensis TaxID=2527968 RepID=A0A518GBI4_9BACT|nr:putative outer membrane efflux protein MdtP [Aureliella helgolandensis]